MRTSTWSTSSPDGVSCRAPRPEKRRENADDHGTTWVLFLNDDYRGGELFWPTREIVLKPRAGTAVRWPTGIPHGLARTDDGYQFT